MTLEVNLNTYLSLIILSEHALSTFASKFHFPHFATIFTYFHIFTFRDYFATMPFFVSAVSLAQIVFLHSFWESESTFVFALAEHLVSYLPLPGPL